MFLEMKIALLCHYAYISSTVYINDFAYNKIILSITYLDCLMRLLYVLPSAFYLCLSDGNSRDV